jgi:RecA-superfamily ATPases implicated in signal transduction
MYNIGPAFDDLSVDPGTNLLVSGAPLSGVRRLAFEAVAAGAAGDEAVLVITTRYSARRVLSDLEALVDTDSITLGIVDCVTRRQDQAYPDDDRVEYVSSPAALTRIGIEFSGFVKQFDTEGIERTRVLFDSLSTLLPYPDTQSLFKFLTVLSGQIEKAGALGIHVIEPAAHDEETRRTLAELFDGRATVADNAVTAVDL